MKQFETETHPFLELQIQTENFDFSKIIKLIIGTFPIYSITQSKPVTAKGISMRNNYKDYARFKFFYGSKMNHFWEMIIEAFQCKTPTETFEAVQILNDNNLFLTDIISVAQRKKEFSSSDSDLKILKYNENLKLWIPEMINMKTIIFTSLEAKKHFCILFNLSFAKERIEKVIINDISYKLITLPTPAGNGRSVKCFYDYFPLNENELRNKETGKSFAKIYRQRLYTEFLSK